METEFDEDSSIHQINGTRGAQVLQIDSGKHVAAVGLCAAICGAYIVLSVWSSYQANLAYTEARMTQYYLQDPSFRTKAELEEWARYKREQEKRK